VRVGQYHDRRGENILCAYPPLGPPFVRGGRDCGRADASAGTRHTECACYTERGGLWAGRRERRHSAHGVCLLQWAAGTLATALWSAIADATEVIMVFNRKAELVARFVRSAVVVAACLVLPGIVSAPSGNRFGNVARGAQEKMVDFRNPAREYEKVKLTDSKYGDVAVFVEKELKAVDPSIVKKAVARLKEKRAEVLALVPKDAQKRLAKVRFFLMYGSKAKNGGKDSGLEYVSEPAPDFHSELDPEWRDVIVIYSAQNYVETSDFWATKALLASLSHAYHLEQWPEREPAILEAWEHAKEAKLYQNVRNVETKEIVPEAFALRNQLGYFGELSCMYFYKCEYEPANREQLKKYDPVGYEMIEKFWKVK
jgi:hypothetical protein